MKQEHAKAKEISLKDRKEIAISAISAMNISDLARSNQVSRKFVYAQLEIAKAGMDKEFNPKSKGKNEVLFTIPVTKAWIEQVILSLTLDCKSSERGIQAFIKTCMDHKISQGHIYNVVRKAMALIQEYDKNEDLSTIQVGSHDEIFLGNKPILTGCDLVSTYCYLLEAEDKRDTDTWGYHFLDLQSKGLNPDYTIADFGSGLRAGQKEAWPGVPCHGDVFHALLALGRLIIYLENRAFRAIAVLYKLEHEMERSKKKQNGHKLSKKLASARIEAQKAIDLFDNLSMLATWMKEDILSIIGPSYQDRIRLYDFLIEELDGFEQQSPYRIKPVKTMLKNQKENLLAFVKLIDHQLKNIAKDYHVSPYLVQQVFSLQGLSENTDVYWSRKNKLNQKLGHYFHPIQEKICEIIESTYRASSIVENLNGRLRKYFYLRRMVGAEYLTLLRFYLNHKPFIRSCISKRVGKSPAELLTGIPHPHWLELLGHNRFKKAA